MSRRNTLADLLANTRREGECMVWLGRIHRRYGDISFAGQRHQRVHRVVYQETRGVTLTTQEYVCHTCDNPPCINPDHLWVGSAADNMADMAAKGRSTAGRVGGRFNRKTTLAQRVEIAARYRVFSHHSSNARELAAEYGIAPSHVRRIAAAYRVAA